jgi:hypothetical protein
MRKFLIYLLEFLFIPTMILFALFILALAERIN